MPSITRRPSGGADRRLPVEARILDTTRRLLGEGVTFTELGVQRIAREAEVARSTFYTHFADKTQLLLRLAESMSQTSFDVAATWRPTPGEDAPGALTEVFRQVVRIYRRHAAVLVAINEVGAYDPVVREFWVSRLERFTRSTEALVRAEQESGRAPHDLDPVQASRLVVLGGDRYLTHHVVVDDGGGDESAARELAATWWYGVYRRPIGQPA
ncbi:TetR/AcrR family transcriptional regulator [Micromonospora krabiensis]|uniref:Transcriptional regulator, TetR family n=1 Tax=Micromonospora krabiensis TaxID=307121 RepID=A0A1C3N8Z3_9ACTN|nr:TetR/AcrR family transcriptional regulator [Micromonospora krabiensis]SBV29064.1 transcriptional regulator, TetR family [Micromonospora krabiensis]